MQIYNVMYKGEQGNKKYIIPGVKNFTTYKKAKEWCEERIEAREAVGSIDDFRCENEDKDTIWYVIYAKKLN